MMANNLARVDWKMGQTLLPEHFVAQEDAFLADTVTRWRLRGLPSYGIAALKLNDGLLSEGVVSLTTVTLVTNTGILVDVPGNASISPFNLNVPGSTTVSVYAHLVGRRPSSDTDAGLAPEEESEVARVVHELVLSSEQSHAEAVGTLKIGEFDKDPDSVWSLTTRYIPPLLRVGTSPYLKRELDTLTDELENFHYKLSQEIAASFLSGDALFTAKQCLKSVYRTQRFIANVREQIRVHPYYLYELLKELLTEICFYRSTAPEHVTEPYRHDALGECFRELFEPLAEQMFLVQAKAPYLPLELKDGMYQVKLPPELRQSKEAYFLVQKSHVNKHVSVDELKMSSFSRAPLMHKLALAGIPLERIDRPPFQHPFGPEVDFYRMKHGEEWDHALRELSVAFYVAPGLENTKFFLYWRLGA